MTASPREEAPRIEFLDGLRGIASLSVVVEHFYGIFTATGDPPYADFFSGGRFGVYVFFFVSGFVIPLSLERGNSLPKFWVSRVFRLMPAYWVAILVRVGAFFVGINQITDGFLPYMKNGWWAGLVANLLMVQMFVNVPNLIGVAWTLNVELIFYLLFSILFLVKFNKNAVSLVYAASGILLFGSIAGLALHHRLSFTVLGTLFVSFLGLMAYRVIDKKISYQQVLAPLAAFSVSFVFAAWVNYAKIPKGTSHEVTFGAATTSYLLALAVFGVAFYYRDVLKIKVLDWLGRISYSMYLIHGLVLACFRFLAPVPQFWVSIAATLLVSELMFRFVEQPGIALGRRLWKAIQSRRALSA